MVLKISSWVKIGIDFIKTLASQWKGRSHGTPPSEPDSGTASECLVTGPDSIVVRPESQISNPRGADRLAGSVRTCDDRGDGLRHAGDRVQSRFGARDHRRWAD